MKFRVEGPVSKAASSTNQHKSCSPDWWTLDLQGLVGASISRRLVRSLNEHHSREPCMSCDKLPYGSILFKSSTRSNAMLAAI